MARVFLFFLFLFFQNTIFAQSPMVQSSSQSTDLQELITHLETEYKWLFSYNQADIQAIKITPPKGELPIDEFLKKTLQKTDLQYEILQNQYVIISKKNTENEAVEAVVLCGKVVDKLTEEALPLANVFLKYSTIGTNAKEDGSFKLAVNLSEHNTLIISYLGYQEQEFSARDFLEKPCKTIALDFADFSYSPIIITEYLTDGISQEKNGAATNIQPAKMGALPGQAEPDVLNAIQFLPGITSPDGTAANVCIRGGTPDQNLILWEDIPIYHSAHYFGMISAFNPYIMDNVAVYRGGFDAEYGGRIAGVIDLQSEAKTIARPSITAGANFLNAYINAKAPLLKNKASLLVSARRSGAEIWRSPTYENITHRIKQGVLLQVPTKNDIPAHFEISDDFRFFDTNAKFAFQISEKDRVSIAGFWGENYFQDVIFDGIANKEQTDTLDLANSGLSATWTHDWSPKWSSKITALISDYHYNYDYKVLRLNDNRAELGRKRSKITEQQIHWVNSYQTATKLDLKVGYQFTNYDIAYLIQRDNNNSNQSNENRAKQSNLHVLYATLNSPLDRKWGVDGGLRYSYFQETNQSYFEPRARVWTKFSEHLTGSFSAGKYYQFLSQLIEFEGDEAGIETPIWVLAGSEETPVLSATQAQIGLVYQHKTWLVDVQAYAKNTSGITSLASGFSDDLDRGYHIGESPAKGLDILVKKRWKKYRTWMSYSLSKADYEFPSFFDQNFPSPNDQRHLFNWTHSWSIGNFRCALGWELRSGRPYSLRQNYRLTINPNPPNPPMISIRPEVPELNTEQLPFEHRLNASFSYTFQATKRSFPSTYIGLSLYNLYNRRNIYSRSFFIHRSPEMMPDLRYLNRADMGFTPNLVLRLEW